MNYIDNFKVFEQDKSKEYSESEQYHDIMGKLLRLYGSIPLPKEKANDAISKILKSTTGPYKLGEDIIIENQLDRNKIRFVDYFDSLIKSKSTRGDNYEGALCGLHDGKLTNIGAKWDMDIDGKAWSVKFFRSRGEKIELGSYKEEISKDLKLKEKVDSLGGLTRVFKTDDTELKEKIFDIVSEGITGGWIIAYPFVSNTEQKKYIGNAIISQYILTTEQMKEELLAGTSPKSGTNNVNSRYKLALSSKYIKRKNYTVSNIVVPKLNLHDLKKIYEANKEWGENVFGSDYGSKIRPDVLAYIRNNSKDISDRLIKFSDF